MKGMQKIKRGSGFRGVLDYAMENGRGLIVGGNMTGNSPRELAAEFGISRLIRQDIEKPVWHNSLRLPNGELLSNEKWCQVADSYMEKMGFTESHQRTYIMHDEPDGQHIHLIASRVSIDGSVYLGQQENLISTRHIQDLEREFGLTITKGPSPQDGVIRKPKKAEMEKSIRTGDAPPRLILQQLVREAAKDKPTIFEFIDRLELVGVGVLPSVASTGTMNGFSFQFEGGAFKGSQLGKQFSWNELKKQVIYEQAKDSARLIEIAGATRGRAHQDDGGIRRTGGENGISDGELDRRNQSDHGSYYYSSEPYNIDGERSGNIEKSVSFMETTEAGKTKINTTNDASVIIDNHCIERLNDVTERVLDIAAPTGDLRSNPRLEPDHRAKIAAWRQQSEALGAPAYRITLVDRDQKRIAKCREDGRGAMGMGYVLGKKNGKDIKTAAEVESEIAELRRANARLFDVYITPIDDNYHYILVDDIHEDTAGKLTKFKVDGFNPVLVQFSSKDNYQAVLKVPKTHGDHDFANDAFQNLNNIYGEPGIKGGVVHPFRMAGFANKKPNKDGFTKLTETNIGAICIKTFDLIKDFMLNFNAVKKQKELEAEKNRRLKAIETHNSSASTVVSNNAVVNAYRRAFNRTMGLAKSKGWNIDISKIDFAATKELLKQGYKSDLIEKAIVEASPNIDLRKGEHMAAYASLTVQKASVSKDVLDHNKAMAEQAKRRDRGRELE